VVEVWVVREPSTRWRDSRCGDDVNLPATSAFDLPDRLAAKAAGETP
jgi:hypothetical protein